MRKLVTAVFVILVAAAPAMAQDDYRPVDVNLGAGWAFPTSDFGNNFGAGWNTSIGITFNLSEHLGLQAEYMYTHMSGPDKTISVSATPTLGTPTNAIVQSNHQMHVGTFNLVYRTYSKEHLVGGYVLGGGGIYHRIVKLMSQVGGYAAVCDPYWLVCYPAPVSLDQIVGDRTSNDFGVNVGGGVTFGSDAKFYVESRYHYVWGKDFTPAGSAGAAACGGSCTSNAAYFPLTFGFRW